MRQRIRAVRARASGSDTPGTAATTFGIRIHFACASAGTRRSVGIGCACSLRGTRGLERTAGHSGTTGLRGSLCFTGRTRTSSNADGNSATNRGAASGSSRSAARGRGRSVHDPPRA